MPVAAFRRVANLLPEAMLLVALDGEIWAANHAFGSLTGGLGQKLAGRRLSDLTVDPEETVRAYLAAAARSTSLLPGAITIRAADREIHPCRVQGARFASESGVQLLLLRISRKDIADRFIDLSERIESLGREIRQRRRAEESLAGRERLLLEMDRRKDEFLAMLSHELRNPLTPLRTGVQILQSEKLPPVLMQVTGMMERQVGQLTRLVDDLLDVARITQGRISLARGNMPLRVALDRAIESVRPFQESRHQTLDVSRPETDVIVNADVERLAQVFMNLLTNAVKFTDAGGTITVSWGLSDGKVRVRVADTGIGISGDLLPKVFDLFVQGDQSLARSMSGLGVGLALVKVIVELHGGEVDASSEGPGKGSEFVVSLPAVDAAERAAAGKASITPSSKKVLIVDDNPDGAESLAILLKAHQHVVQTAKDAFEALSVLGSFEPNAILLDIGLPGMDGFTFAQQLRARPQTKTVLIVAVTGYGQEQDRVRSRNAGFDYHLTKPVDLEVLQTLLASSR